MYTQKNNEKGFTIIEVVLVLAIAGLIFLIVFLALPQLQSSRRDTQRKNDAGRLLAAVENWAGNHSGNYPVAGTGAGQLPGTSGTDWTSSNISGNFNDPSTGSAYSFGSSWSATAPEGTMVYLRNAACSSTSDGPASGTFGAREIAVFIVLENGHYCQDNQ